MKNLKINNIFYSIAGEGNNVGMAAIFIRLSGCNEKCEFCDTDHSFKELLSVEEILERLQTFNCKSLVWTGGEPCLQLTTDIVEFFNSYGYNQYLETNGSLPLPNGLLYVSCSPKLVSMKKLKENVAGYCVGEFRCVIGINEEGAVILPPKIKDLPNANFYYVSPLFVGEMHKKLELDRGNLKMAIDFVKADSRWRLSVQSHKIWVIP